MPSAGRHDAHVEAGRGLPPQRLDTVPRARLLDGLRSSAARVVLVSAPAGSGKSVLILDWLRTDGADTAWLSLDAQDNDPVRFRTRLAEALESSGEPAFLRGAAVLRRLGTDGSLPADAFLREVASHDGGATLVFDDVHAIESAEVMGLLGDLVAAAAAGPRVVLIGRADPSLPLGRLRVSGQLHEVRERDLRFTRDEAAELLRRALPFPVAPDFARRVTERTEGWAAGLRLAAIALRQAPDPERALSAFAGSNALMSDYLLEEVLSTLDPSIQGFLMETSVLPRFNGAGCRRVTGDDDAPGHLRWIEDANLFLVPLSEDGRWYRYHHLFAELLDFRLRTLHPQAVPGLQRRAAAWLEEVGHVQEALEVASRMEDPGLLLELLDRHGYPILARSEFASFARWLELVPDPLGARHPMFLAAVAWFRAQTERAPDLDGLLEGLEDALAAPPEGYPAARLEEAGHHLRALRAFALRMSDRYPEALEAGERALRDIPQEARAMRGIVEFNLGAVHLRLGDMAAARRHLERGYDLCLQGGVPYLVLASLGHLGYVLAQTEGLTAARTHLEGAVAFGASEGLDGVPAFAIVLYQLAQVHWLSGDAEGARVALERALTLTRGERESDIHANVRVHLARLATTEGSFAEAEGHLSAAAALAHAHNVKYFATSLELERARLSEVRDGRIRLSDEGPRLPGPGESWTTVHEGEALFQARHAAADGRWDECAALASRVRVEAEARGRGIALCGAQVAQALAAGDPGLRREALASAVELAARRGYVRPLVDFGGQLAGLLASPAAGGLSEPASDFVRTRVSPLLPPAVPPPPYEGGQGLLTEREAGTVALVAQGLSNEEIARALFVSVNTVKTHLKRIFAKLGASTRTEAVRLAREQGVIPPQA